jgi:hypothetical protein
MNKTTLSILALIIVSGLSYASNNDMQEAQSSHSEYCKNVELFESTRGRDGHPDYDIIYDKTCLDQDK